MPSILQNWVQELPFMQQTTLLTAIRAPDGNKKYDPPKMLLRWYRRCILISALDKEVLCDPVDPRGGSFTGPSVEFKGLNSLSCYDRSQHHSCWKPKMDVHVDGYITNLDGIPAHFQRHFMHAVQILGYKHPSPYTRKFWNDVYIRLVKEMHLHPELEDEMDLRLSDNRDAWLANSDKVTQR